jgi:hypothetical protein
MMTLFVDTAFFDELAQRTDLDNEIVEDFYKVFLRKVRGIEVVINLPTAQNIKELSNKSRYYSDLLEINPGVKTEVNWKAEVIQDKVIFKGNPIKLFLLPNDVDCNTLEKKYGYLFVNNRNLVEKWAPVRYNRDITKLTTGLKSDEFTFCSWSRLLQEKHPLNEILILDLFVLEDKVNQHICDNLIPLVKTLRSFCYTELKLKLIIIADKILNSNQARIYEMLRKAYEQLQTEICNIDLYIVHYDKEDRTIYQKTGDFNPEHDREIYTNYLKLECGAGWNIFKKDGSVNHRTTINIQSLFRNDVRLSAMNACKNLSVYRNKVKNGVEKLIYGCVDTDGKMKKHKVFFCYPEKFESKFLN